MKIKLRHVVEDVDRHGNVRLYFARRGQRKIRLYGMPGSPQFMEQYREALAGKIKPAEPKPDKIAEGSFRHLCIRYFDSAAFKGLARSTQHARRLILDRVCRGEGDKPYRKLTAPHIMARRDAMADRPEAANEFVKALRQLYAFAVDVRLADHNPARDVKLIASTGEGFHAWSETEIAQFAARHPIGSKAHLAFALLLYTGQRRGDVVRLGHQHIRRSKEGRFSEWLVFTQEKNARHKPVKVEIPIIPELVTAIQACPSGTLTFLVTEFGRPFSNAGFGNWFRDRCTEAGLPQCSAHGLRKAATARLAENGCTENEIMAITGHQTLKEVARYTRSARRSLMAEAAMNKLAPEHHANKSIPLSTVKNEGGMISARKSLK